jgi:hypothetical protein
MFYNFTDFWPRLYYVYICILLFYCYQPSYRPDLTELADFLKSLGATEVVTEEAAQGYQFKSIIEKLGKPKLALNGVGGKSSLSLLRTLG